MCKIEIQIYFYCDNVRIHKQNKKTKQNKTKQKYGVKLYFKLVLNILKVIGGLTSIYTLLRT